MTRSLTWTGSEKNKLWAPLRSAGWCVPCLFVLLASACGESAPAAVHTDIHETKFFDIKFQVADVLTDSHDDTLLDSAADGADVPPAPGTFGAPCSSAGDCESGWCVQGPNGEMCSKSCVDGCPTGWLCKQIQGSSDTSFVCEPATTHLCEPCTQSGKCNEAGGLDNLCVAFGSTGSYCGIACDPAKAACPTGYACMEVPGGSDGIAHQCLPTNNQCACSTYARQLGASTACTRQNLVGTCTGKRQCGPQGLSACDAPEAVNETCNGIDDDCNGKTDEGLEGQPCEIKNEFGTCKGKTTGCTSDGPVCGAPAAKPELCNGLDDDCNGLTDDGLCEDGNPCTIGLCDGGGTCKQIPKLAGSACDDGNVCTQTDLCTVSLCVGSNLLICDDQNPCTQDQCDAKAGCQHVAQSGTPCLDDGNACTQDLCQTGAGAHPCVAAGSPCAADANPCTADFCDGAGVCKPNLQAGVCLIGGQCVQAGLTDPTNACQVCDPKQSTSAYVVKDGLGCDDGDACTGQDACKAGVCKGAPMDCSAKNAECQQGACLAGACIAQPLTGACDDGDACTLGDVCKSGICTGVAMDCSSFDGLCLVGACSGGACHAATRTGACDDGDACTLSDACMGGTCVGKAIDCSGMVSACTSGTCVGGTCIAQPIDGSCDDGNACTLADDCTMGTCLGSSNQTCDDQNPCTADVCDATFGCSHFVLSGNACLDDGNACTQDLCQTGFCTHPSVAGGTGCDLDGNACTFDTCDGSGACTPPAVLTGCAIGGQCVTAGSLDPKDPCKACIPMESLVSYVAKDGLACDDGDPCTLADACSSDVCLGTAKDCSSLNANCQKGVCSGGTCTAQVTTGSCDDGDPCTVSDTCNGATCAGTAMDCSALTNACGPGVCSGGVCSQAFQGVCKPGDVQNDQQGCGACGSQTRSRTCTSACAWGDWSAWGACGGQGACYPGQVNTQTQGCGACGSQSQSQTCQGNCQWGGWSGWGGCGGQGACYPGQTTTSGCVDAGCTHKTCGGNCQWGGCGLNGGAACAWNSGTGNGSNWRCCGTHDWQFCLSNCQWSNQCVYVANACY